MTTIAQLAERLQTLFTTTADDLGRRTGFVERASKLTGALFAQALVFGWLADPAASLPQLAAAAALAGVRITPQGLDQRCTSAAAGFLERLLSAAVAVLVQAETVAIPLLERFTAVELLDASTIVLPDGLADWWPGCGGSSPTNTGASLKVHVRFDLCSGALRGPLLTDGRTHESTTALQTAPLPPGALRIADLGVPACGSASAWRCWRRSPPRAPISSPACTTPRRCSPPKASAPAYSTCSAPSRATTSRCSWAVPSACRPGSWRSGCRRRWPPRGGAA